MLKKNKINEKSDKARYTIRNLGLDRRILG